MASGKQIDQPHATKVTVLGRNPSTELQEISLDANGNLATIDGHSVSMPLRTDPTGTTIQPVSGTLDVNVLSGGGSNASVGTTGAAAPASATEIGLIDASGNLRGIAASQGLPTITGDIAESTAAWTSATAQNTAVTLTVKNYNTVVVALNQGSTITGGVVTFEVSDTTAFTNAYTIFAMPVTSLLAANLNPLSTYTLVANVNQGFLVNVAGWAAFRVRLSTVIAGSATVNVGVAATAAAVLPMPFAKVDVNTFSYLASNALPVLSGADYTDGAVNTILRTFATTGGGLRVGAVGVVGYTGTPVAANSVALRTPNIWRGSQFSGAGVNVLWTPPSAKKARLMKYKIEVGEDATLSGGPLPINLAFSEVLGTASGATLAYPGFGFTHRLVVPAAVLATSFNGYDSGWVDLGNGQLTTTAALASVAAPVAALGMGIMIPQGTGAINPTWTSASVTWEAATAGFKTNGNLGNFKLVQQQNAVASAASVATAAAQHVTGDAVFVFWRATVSGGAPTMTVTDTAGNTYTNAAQVTTGNDYIGMAYAINIKGSAANVVTATTTTHTSSQIEIIVVEYAGLGSAGVDAAQVGTTGTSTAPASGNYTPSTVGDLIFSYFGSSATVTSQPIIGSNFRLVGTLFNATQGSLCVADNFGNGSLLAGVVNCITVGTEE